MVQTGLDKDALEFKYSVTIPYLSYEERLSIREWCEENGFFFHTRYKDGFEKSQYMFSQEEQAVLFTLRFA